MSRGISAMMLVIVTLFIALISAILIIAFYSTAAPKAEAGARGAFFNPIKAAFGKLKESALKIGYEWEKGDIIVSILSDRGYLLHCKPDECVNYSTGASSGPGCEEILNFEEEKIGGFPRGVGVGDLNGDGFYEVVFTNRERYSIYFSKTGELERNVGSAPGYDAESGVGVFNNEAWIAAHNTGNALVSMGLTSQNLPSEIPYDYACNNSLNNIAPDSDIAALKLGDDICIIGRDPAGYLMVYNTHYFSEEEFCKKIEADWDWTSRVIGLAATEDNNLLVSLGDGFVYKVNCYWGEEPKCDEPEKLCYVGNGVVYGIGVIR